MYVGGMACMYDCRFMGSCVVIVDVYLLLYEFIFKSVYLGDSFHLVVMLPKFLLIWSCYEFGIMSIYISMTFLVDM